MSIVEQIISDSAFNFAQRKKVLNPKFYLVNIMKNKPTGVKLELRQTGYQMTPIYLRMTLEEIISRYGLENQGIYISVEYTRFFSLIEEERFWKKEKMRKKEINPTWGPMAVFQYPDGASRWLPCKITKQFNYQLTDDIFTQNYCPDYCLVEFLHLKNQSFLKEPNEVIIRQEFSWKLIPQEKFDVSFALLELTFKGEHEKR